MTKNELRKLILDEDAHCFNVNREFCIIIIADICNAKDIAYKWYCDNYSKPESWNEIDFGYRNCETWEECEDAKIRVDEIINTCNVIIDAAMCQVTLNN